MEMSDITAALEGIGVPVYEGYPASGARLPYVVHRPLLIDVPDTAVCGDAVSWNYQHAVYCCGASVEASFNLARLVMSTLQGKRVGDSTLATTMGYSGALMEGRYESQVTAQAYQGGI